MSVRAAAGALALWAGLVCADAAQAQTPASCRQALALGLDVSGSVDGREYRLQLDGLAAALDAPRVREILLASPDAPVRVMVYEWSGVSDVSVVLPWTEIGSEAALGQAIATLRAHERQPAHPSTALGVAMSAGIRFLNQQPECWKRTLDISGDGKSNTGPRPQDIPNPPGGVTINALVIGADDPQGGDQRQVQITELSAYFAAHVIRGPDAFVETALGFDRYAAAMERKLIRELQSLAIGAAEQP